MNETYHKSKLFWLIVPSLVLSLSQFPSSATSNLQFVAAQMKKSHTGQEAQADNSVNECQFKGHFDDIISLTFSPDGKTFISVSKDNTSKIWDTSTGELLRTFTGYSGSILSVAIGADDNIIIIGSDDKNIIKLWDLSTGKLLHQFKGHADLVNSVAISPNGQTLVSGSWDKTIKLWDIATEKLLHTFTGHSEWVNSVAISPDGQTLVSGSSDKTVKLWNINTGNELRTLKGHSEIVISLAISPDGQTLVSGSGEIKVWALTTGKEIITLKGHSPMVESLAISSDGSKFVSGAWDSTIKIWDIKTLKLLHTLGKPVNPSASLPQNTPNGLFISSISPSTVTISPNGHTLVSGNRSTIKLWNMQTGQSIQTIAGHSDGIESVIISPDQKTIISVNPSEIPHLSINLWDIDSGKQIQTIKDSWIRAVAISPDGNTLVSGGWSNKAIKLWDVHTGKLIRIFEDTGVESVAISPDGTILANNSNETIKLRNILTGELIYSLEGHSFPVISLTISQNGDNLISRSSEEMLLWDIRTGKLIRTLQEASLDDLYYDSESTNNTNGVNSSAAIATSPDGSIFAIKHDHNRINLQDTRTGETIHTLKGDFSGYDTTTIISPDKNTLVRNSYYENSIQLWDLPTGKLTHTLEGHLYRISSLAVSADSKILVSGSYDNTIKIWDMNTGTLLKTFCE